MIKFNTFFKFSFLVCLLFAIRPNALSQNLASLTGVVLTEDGTAAVGASVQLQGTNFAAIADHDGRFLLSNVPHATYSIVVRMVGYKTFTRKQIVGSETESEIRIVLIVDSQSLQTVEITGRRNSGYTSDYSFAATKAAIPVTEIPSTVSTITQQLIRDRQAVRFDDVARNTNVRVTNNGRSVVIRGFVSTTRLINGLRTLNENYRFPSISPVVESYEVVKGPSSSMFGNMSPGGVVNLVTKKPLADKKQSFSFSAGSFNTIRSDMDFTGKVTEDGKVLYRLNAFGQLSDTWYQNMKDNAVAVAPSFSFLPTEGTRINVDLNYTQLTTMENDGLFPFKGKSIDQTPIGFTVLQPGDRNKTTTTSINLSASQKLARNVSLNVSYLKDFLIWDDKRHAANVYLRDAAWSRGDSAISVAYSEWNTKMDSDNITGYLSADLNTGKVSHKALLGYDFNSSLFNWGSYRYTTSAIGSVNVYDPAKSSPLDGSIYTLGVSNYDRVNKTRDYANGLYFQDQISILERLKVMLGLRYEAYTFRLAYQSPGENEVSQNAWLPKVGVTYNLPSHTHVYGSYITGFQPVSSGSLVFGKVEGGGELKPEYSNQFEFGVKQELFNKNLLVTLAAYQIKKINVTQLTNPSVVNANDRIWRQLGEVSSKGIELEANGQIGRSLSVNVAYNYNDAKITKDLLETNVGLKQGLAPAHQGSIWAKYEVGGNAGILKGLGLATGVSFSSKTPMLQAPALTTPGYSVWDAAISYKIDRVTLSLNMNNIANKRYYTGAVRATERFYTGAPRNVMFRIGYSI